MATPKLPTVTKITGLPVPSDASSKSHHLLSKTGKLVGFRNTHDSFNNKYDGSTILPAAFKLLTDRVRGKLGPMPPIPSPCPIPVRKPTFITTRIGPSALRATWLGHACYFLEFPSGLRVLFDPVFEEICAPTSLLSSKRFTPVPCSIADLPFLDAVVISHSHFDHLSHPTVQEITKHHPTAHFFVPLGLQAWFRKQGITNVTELDWWEDAELTVPADEATIRGTFSCLPAQHSSGRSGFDKDTTLWASWAVSSTLFSSDTKKSVYFGGDTGYRAVPEDIKGDDYLPHLPTNPDFGKIGTLRGPFTLGLLPIGAYRPRYLMSSVHANPFDAVEIFRDTRCEKAMGIHWGTWQLTFEDVMEPPVLLREALARRGLPERGVFDICDVGESREF
ncbi:NAPE-hydrolyzing phospholipase [Echria macrotheca]|uniref:NAPE-hydrolyzing phospholipase n=1 Tax=Echria macrotheca TaxID=438768 RepID=A0AAJ0F8E5_9PEZI|nr:NAPE-hydrolyzing phospholipase [Echria macrotheca]